MTSPLRSCSTCSSRRPRPESNDDPKRDALVRQIRRVLRRGTDAAQLAAVSAAARIRRTELLPDVAPLLRRASGPEVATRLVDWGADALAFVQRAVDSASAESVRHVATALSRRGRRGPLLHRLLAHADPEVRDRAVRSLSYAVAAQNRAAPARGRDRAAALAGARLGVQDVRDPRGPREGRRHPRLEDRRALRSARRGDRKSRSAPCASASCTSSRSPASTSSSRAVQAGLRKKSAEVDAKIAELVDATLDARSRYARRAALRAPLAARARASRATIRGRRLASRARSALGNHRARRRDHRRPRDAGIQRPLPRALPAHLGGELTLDPALRAHGLLAHRARSSKRCPATSCARVAEMLDGRRGRGRRSRSSRRAIPGDALYIVRRGAVVHQRRRDRALDRAGPATSSASSRCSTTSRAAPTPSPRKTRRSRASTAPTFASSWRGARKSRSACSGSSSAACAPRARASRRPS